MKFLDHSLNDCHSYVGHASRRTLVVSLQKYLDDTGWMENYHLMVVPSAPNFTCVQATCVTPTLPVPDVDALGSGRSSDDGRPDFGG